MCIISAGKTVLNMTEDQIEKTMVVEIKGYDHFVQEITDDTCEWLAGPRIVEFHNQHNVELMSFRVSTRPDVTTFFFPGDRPDIAALFKLIFA